MRLHSEEYFCLVCIHVFLPRHLCLGTTKDGISSGIGTHWSDMVWLFLCWANTQDSCSQATCIPPSTEVCICVLPNHPLSSLTPGKRDCTGSLLGLIPHSETQHSTRSHLYSFNWGEIFGPIQAVKIPETVQFQTRPEPACSVGYFTLYQCFP